MGFSWGDAVLGLDPVTILPYWGARAAGWKGVSGHGITGDKGGGGAGGGSPVNIGTGTPRAYNPEEIDNIYQQNLGRKATPQEHDFFKPYVEQGSLSPYQIGQYAQGTPEAQQSRLGQYGGQYENFLARNDKTILGRAADVAQGQFAENGRQFSTGQGNAILQAGENLAMNRDSMLSNFYGSGYKSLMGQYAGQSQDAMNRGFGLSDIQNQRGYDMGNYYLQQNDYNNYLKGQNTRNLQEALISGAVGLPAAYLRGRGAGGKSLFS